MGKLSKKPMSKKLLSCGKPSTQLRRLSLVSCLFPIVHTFLAFLNNFKKKIMKKYILSIHVHSELIHLPFHF